MYQLKRFNTHFKKHYFQMNLSDIARRYGVGGTTANCVIKEFLEDNNVDISSFRTQTATTKRIRRSIAKIPGT